jgi:hypothetical protein
VCVSGVARVISRCKAADFWRTCGTLAPVYEKLTAQ